MEWSEFKQLTAGELIDFGQALERHTDGEQGVVWAGQPIEKVARAVVLGFIDDGVLRFPEGSLLENLTDAGIAMADSQIDWVDRAKGILGTVLGFLDMRPLAKLPG